MTDGGRRGAYESAWGPDAGRHVKLLIQFAVKGLLSGAYSQPDLTIDSFWRKAVIRQTGGVANTSRQVGNTVNRGIERPNFFHCGDDANFPERPGATSSTAC
jgi:hypothetical protein